MSWLQIRINIQPEKAEQYEDILFAAGCEAVTFEDNADEPILEPELGTTPLWQNTCITGLFPANQDLHETQNLIEQAHLELFGDHPMPSLKAEILEDKDWERAWMDNYHPMKFGERLWICPSWQKPPEPSAVNLMLDPGLAFGTGTHPTTALCLEWLDSIDVAGLQVTDYGCGSGILGIAALLLGAKQLTAIDLDPQALTATLDNAQRNSIQKDKIQIYLPDEAPHFLSDILVANILAGPLTALAETLASRVKPGGRIALSGLLADQGAALQEKYAQWFDIDAVTEKEGWIRVSGIRK